LISAARAPSVSLDRAARMTSAPAAAISRAMARPMPRLAPATRAVLPAREKGFTVPLYKPRRPGLIVDAVNEMVDNGIELRAGPMDFDERVGAVREFNRFYTRRIGVLHEGLLESPFSLTESRVLFELAHREQPAAAELAKELELDAGYLSRILSKFKKLGLVSGKPAQQDGRQTLLWLTRKGHGAFAVLNARSQKEVSAMLAAMSETDQIRLVESMETISRVAGGSGNSKTPCVLRPPAPGDMGEVVRLHGLLYAQEYGFDRRFEGLVAGIAARFVERYDSKRERCWIAEKEGKVVGSVFLVKHSKTVAKLRMLLVTPEARGLGLGARLVNECVAFARLARYRKITLWTNSVLAAARHIYQKAGFRLVNQEPHRSFGMDLVSETWELRL
jgi:DNA-binding MarR family transcriptional regulator/N-acetylglutamate synthase-like GNAT family acetyltransferase